MVKGDKRKKKFLLRDTIVAFTKTVYILNIQDDVNNIFQGHTLISETIQSGKLFCIHDRNNFRKSSKSRVIRSADDGFKFKQKSL